jgi:wobble nucleotide-excising tRNase
MIEKFSKIDLGCFNNFDWNSTVTDHGNEVKFSKMNIIYGHNYAGKTTLSRIVHSISNKDILNKYNAASISIQIKQDDQAEHYTDTAFPLEKLSTYVYNKDFIHKNLKFLVDEDSKIEPFALLGGGNVEIQSKIDQLRKEIGNDELGIAKDFNLASKEYSDNTKSIKVIEQEIGDVLKKCALALKKDYPHLLDKSIYTKKQIENDLKQINTEKFECLLTEESSHDLTCILKSKHKGELHIPDLTPSSYSKLISNANTLLCKKVSAQKVIEELAEDTELNKWVEDGITHHKGKRKICVFCGGDIPEKLWATFDDHFSKEVEIVQEELSSQINLIKKEQEKFDSFPSPPAAALFENLAEQFTAQEKNVNNAFQAYILALRKIEDSLVQRKNNIFKPLDPISSSFNQSDLTTEQEKLLSIMQQHNELSAQFEDKQKKAKKKLRFNEVLKIIASSPLGAKEKKLQNECSNTGKLKETYLHYKTNLKELNSEIELLEDQLSDEKEGAKKVTEYLNNFFGHSSLTLKCVDEEKGTKFSLYRGDSPAKNLSEGECSLIAFCYFIAKLGSLQDKINDAIVWIDDPISSLDSNHVFFIYSLIESVIAKEATYKQLFISTHNLDFLKYLKAMTKPPKGNPALGEKKDQKSLFLLQNDGTRSYLSPMPKYLKLHATEFNYLFEEIHKCSLEDTETQDYNYYHSLGNNLRKFLECYLYFKFPSNDDWKSKFNRFFPEEKIEKALVFRLVNEFSHTEDQFDRARNPISIPEMKTAAEYVLQKIADADEPQYNSLLQSIGVKPAA